MKRSFLWAGLFAAGIAVGLAIGALRRARPAGQTEGISPGPALLVTLSATIDGSDRFIFTRDNVWNEHGQWQPPQRVLFNGEPWPDLSAAPAGWADLVKNLDLVRASIASRKGRDVMALERTADGFELFLADSQMGAGAYEVTISIPRK